jgi:hypothetical protein
MGNGAGEALIPYLPDCTSQTRKSFSLQGQSDTTREDLPTKRAFFGLFISFV